MGELLQHNYLASIFFPALLLSLWLTPVVIRHSFRLNAVDYPNDRNVHDKPISRMGGATMVVGLVLPLVFFTPMDRTMVAFLVGVFIIAATGFLDDVYHIPPVAKFAGEIVAAGAFVFLSGISIQEFGDLFGIGEISSGRLGPLLTIFCMVGVMNALNLSDGLDGLAGGISAIACIFLGLFAYLSAEWGVFWILLALLGSLFGFLRYNTYPANLFMGDTGSLLLGYTLSVSAVILVRNDHTGMHLTPTMVAGVLALPITDTLLVMFRRFRHGENPFLPDRTHLHHRLLALGFPHAVVVPILYLSAGAFGLQVWFLREAPDWVQFAAVVLLAALIHGGVYTLQRVGYRWKGREAPGLSHEDLVHSWIARVMGKSVRLAAGAILIGIVIPLVALPVVPRVFSGIAIAAIVFVAALFPWRAQRSRPSVAYALMWFACLSLLALLQAIPGSPDWVPGYLAVLSAIVLLWVLLKMKYCGHREIIQISSFELLLLSIVLFAALVMVPALHMGDGLRNMLFAVSLESVAFLLAMKILIHRQQRRNSMVVAGFLLALALIVAKGFLFSEKTAQFALAPAVFPVAIAASANPSVDSPESSPEMIPPPPPKSVH